MRRSNRLHRFIQLGSTALLVALLLLAPLAAFAQEGDAPAMVIDVPQATSPDDLLRKVREGFAVEQREDAERERRFQNAREEQRQLLADRKAEEARQEARSQALEKTYQENEVKIAELEEALEQRMGNLGELFGVTRQVSGDSRGLLEASLTTSQFGLDRADFLEELGKSKELPSIEELRGLWAEMLNEMNEQGKVVTYEADVFTPSGVERKSVTRVGAFTAIADGEYLLWDPVEKKLQTLSRQPPARFTATVDEYTSGGPGLTGLAVDPSSGSLLAVLIESRSLVERVQQQEGGAVGNVIIALGSLAFLLGVFKWVVLFLESRKVAAQKKSSTPNTNNSLGKVLAVAADNPDADREQLELMLDEVVLRESGKLESLVWLVRIVSVVAPLLGLLGTVTGMIRTFQSITLFGAGDPRMMAGGISEALMTTMLGLVTAIPLVLLHAALANNTKKIVDTLDEQSAGLIAQQE